MLSDLPIVFYWWFLLFGLGVVFLPLTLLFFKRFFDQGYVFSKIIALFLISYSVWLSVSLKIVLFSKNIVWLFVIGFIFLNYHYFLPKKSRQGKSLGAVLKNNWKIWLFEEILFLGCLIGWSFVRGFQPDIHGLEKFMDYGFINSIIRSEHFPPNDMWLAGRTINYYYFGHLVAAVLTLFSGITSAVTYNLMVATIFAFCFTAGFSISANLTIFAMGKRKFAVLAGLFSAFLLSMGGNLQLFWYFLKNKSLSGYWYPDATRFIVQKFGAADNTIHEFPLYSFVVADLHGHLLNLPFVLLFLALSFSFFQKKIVNLVDCCFAGLLLAVMFMTNAWDLPIYLLVLGLVFLWSNWKKYGLMIKTIYKTAILSIACCLLFVLFSFPFYFHFNSIAQGIKLVDFHSPVWMLLILWGWPLVLTLSFFAMMKWQKAAKLQKSADKFVLILLFVAWLLIFIPEIIYVKDIYIHSYQRANTMFKLTYQSFVMFALSSGYIVVRILANIKKRLNRVILYTLYFILYTSVMVYPYFAVKSFYGLRQYHGLNGLKYLKRSYFDDWRAILWLRKNIVGQPVILEAVGDSYTDFARVSANTGLPTIVGWPVHEWLWRGSYDQVGKRKMEVQKIYESTAIGETKALLKKYEVKYIFIGMLEKKAYKKLNEKKFKLLGKVVYQKGRTKIYKL